MKLSRRDLLKSGALATTVAALPAGGATRLPGNKPFHTDHSVIRANWGESLKFRATLETFHQPFWHEEHGMKDKADKFWNRAEWEKRFAQHACNGLTAIIYWLEPWLVHQWQTWLVRYKHFPEANDLTPEQSERVIEDVNWIFAKAKQMGMTNFVMHMEISVTQNYSRAHGLDKDMPLSDSVDWRHNFQHKVPGGITYDKMIHWGVRCEETRAFVEYGLAELFQAYPDLDGVRATLGEALPGRRSEWFNLATTEKPRQ